MSTETREEVARLLERGYLWECVLINPYGGSFQDKTLEQRRRLAGVFFLTSIVKSIFAWPEQAEQRLELLTYLLDEVKVPCSIGSEILSPRDLPFYVALAFPGEISYQVRKILLDHNADKAPHPIEVERSAFEKQIEMARTGNVVHL